MKRKRCSDEQIAFALRQAWAGTPVEHKRVHPIYRQEDPSIRLKTPRRKLAIHDGPAAVIEPQNNHEEHGRCQ